MRFVNALHVSYWYCEFTADFLFQYKCYHMRNAVEGSYYYYLPVFVFLISFELANDSLVI